MQVLRRRADVQINYRRLRMLLFGIVISRARLEDILYLPRAKLNKDVGKAKMAVFSCATGVFFLKSISVQALMGSPRLAVLSGSSSGPVIAASGKFEQITMTGQEAWCNTRSVISPN